MPHDPTKCKRLVPDMGHWNYFQCSRKAVLDGYCKQHHPDSVKKREEEADRRYREKIDNDPKTILAVKLKKAEAALEMIKSSLTTKFPVRENWDNICKIITEYYNAR